MPTSNPDAHSSDHTMRKRPRLSDNAFKRPIIDHIENHGIDPSLHKALFKWFEYAMRSLSTTYAREAWFDIADIPDAHGTRCARYSIYMKRFPFKDTRMVFWDGFIHHRNGRNTPHNDRERMDVSGHLEDFEDVED